MWVNFVKITSKNKNDSAISKIRAMIFLLKGVYIV